MVRAGENELVTFECAGSIGRYASSRGVPGREALSRSERKFLALETLEFRLVDVAAPIDTLHFWRSGRFARVIRGWRRGEFLGWYVNFEKPPVVHADRVITMDLVLDALVARDGGWTWKDEADFDEAVRRGLVTPDEAVEVRAEASRLKTELAERRGPFAESWDSWRPS
ncbi:MAG: DUF402 domain-containing protein [Nocardioidaceae bacterium]|nr:DUF402 domain-containing protein [Nocardioidaceae bacterium]